VGHGQGTRYSACAANRLARAAAPPPATRPSADDTRPGWSTGIALVVAAVTVAWSAWRALRRFERVEVFGLSMAPALQPGDRILVWKTTSVHRGDIVAAPDPRLPARSVLKRVSGVTDGGLLLLGDNPDHSTDSRQWGPVQIASIQGKAVYRYAPPGRAGRLSQPVSSGE
jgi:signal peptidase I